MKSKLICVTIILVFVLTTIIVYTIINNMSWTNGTPIPLPSIWFENGDETYSELMHNGNHWEWEITLSTVEIIIIDIIIGLFVWPFIKEHFHRDIKDSETEDDKRHNILINRVKILEYLLGVEEN